MAGAARHALGVPMKTQKPQIGPGKATQEKMNPSPEAVRWKMAAPPRLVQREPVGAVGEWRPEDITAEPLAAKTE